MLTLKEMQDASDYVIRSGYCRRTPMLSGVEKLIQCPTEMNLFLKMEQMQNGGCFKIRGVANQLHHIKRSDHQKLVTFSGGNYGKAFAMLTGRMKIPSLVVMSTRVPQNRVTVIKSFGSDVELVEPSQLVTTVKKHQSNGMVYLDPFDDLNLIAPYGGVAFEIVEDVPHPDVVVVPCGGGGLLSGTAAGLRATGHEDCKIYGVEPETANTMQKSFEIGEPAKMPDARSVATGLCPPYAGSITYKLCKANVNGILTVSDDSIVNAVRILFGLGLIVEPSGAAGLAAVLDGLPTETVNKNVVVVLSGGNITLSNLKEIVD